MTLRPASRVFDQNLPSEGIHVDLWVPGNMNIGIELLCSEGSVTRPMDPASGVAPQGNRTVTLTFHLKVRGTPPENTYFGGACGTPGTSERTEVPLNGPYKGNVYMGVLDCPVSDKGKVAYAFIQSRAGRTGPNDICFYPKDCNRHGPKVVDADKLSTVYASRRFKGRVLSQSPSI